MTRTWPPAGAIVVCFVTICAQVPWRADVFYTGGADPVVIAKAALTLGALGIAWLVFRTRRERYPVAAQPFLWMAGFLACTIVGGATDDRLLPTIVLAIRVALVLLIVAALVRTYRPIDVLHAIVVVFGVLVWVATGTTLALGTVGRLHGGLPPLHANELASLATICLIWVVARIARGEDRPASIMIAFGCVAVVVLTQSRTSLVAGVTAIAVVAVLATRVRVALVYVAACVPAGLYALVFLTPIADQLIRRGEQAERLVTFADRLYAWRAALDPNQPLWHHWFGGGLAQKTVEVTGQPWTSQVLDSSWVSALVQAGWLGLAIGIAWLSTMLVQVFRGSRAWRGALVALVVFLGLRGLLESGLFDASTSFIVLAALAFASTSAPTRPATLEPDPDGSLRVVRQPVTAGSGRG